jgi:prepilin-type N-terminal cleavage/methylation domain-containing protein
MFPGRAETGSPALRSGGFTLIEILLVMAIVALMAAIAAPQLMPAILLSELEGSSRHVAGFGRAALSEAVLMRDTITVRIDLTNQEYWATHLVGKHHDLFDEDEDEKSNKKSEAVKESSKKKSKKRSSSNDGHNGEFLNLLGYSKSDEDGSNWGESATSDAGLMRKQFDRFSQTQMLTRSKQVKREGLLDEIGPLFEKKFSLDDDEEVEEELMDPLLARESLPKGVKIESVHVGGTSYSKGEVDIEITPLGLVDPVTFYIKGDESGYYTVIWDPITGNVHLQEGKQDAA